MTKELQQFEKMDVSAVGCDAYLAKMRKECNDLIVKLHGMGAVNDELLLHQPTRNWNEMQEQLISQCQRCIGKVFLLQYTGLCLPAL